MQSDGLSSAIFACSFHVREGGRRENSTFARAVAVNADDVVEFLLRSQRDSNPGPVPLEVGKVVEVLGPGDIDDLLVEVVPLRRCVVRGVCPGL